MSSFEIPNDYPFSKVADWLLNQASRDYRQHEIDALKKAGCILAALEGGVAQLDAFDLSNCQGCGKFRHHGHDEVCELR